MKAKKSLGQNFLIDECVRDAIIDAASISRRDTVLEIGPGKGVLTDRLAEQAGKVVAVEVDAGLAAGLKRRMQQFGNVRIVHGDILETDLAELFEDAPYKVVANIPYYITSPILHRLVQSSRRPELMLIMMQKEVALDVTARPGRMTFLAVSMQVFSRPEIVCIVPAASFMPKPKVDSAVVRFNMLPRPMVASKDLDGYLELVHAGFAAPRKKLRNSLALGLRQEPAEAERLLERAGMDPEERPGAMTPGQWLALYRVMEGEGANA